MNDVEIIAQALLIDSDDARNAHLIQACGESNAMLAGMREILRRAQIQIVAPKDLAPAELLRQVEAVFKEVSIDGSSPIANRDEDSVVPLTVSPVSDQTQAIETVQWATSVPETALLPTESSAPTVQSTTTIAGRYILQKKIGEGGMGEVWLAKQLAPIKRNVALKLIKQGMNSKAVVSRFEQERQALAVMDHPNIARVYDGGLTEQGQPYFAMEFVSGRTLIEYSDKEQLTTEERLRLFISICNAVQHAHQKGIVHRDLKPANILVTTVDGKPVPKVIDFGVAKATGGRLIEHSMNTQFGAIIGTLEYMAPEQAGYAGVDVDTRADIYSLGVVLYELLTGLRPIDATRLQRAGLAEMIRVIREDEPSKPSTRLSTSDSLPAMAASRRIEPKRLTALLRGELDWVVMKCLEKQRERRYETANGLARDLQRFLANEIVEARPPSRSYRMRKFISKHRGQVLSASVVLIALLIGSIAATLGLLEAQRQAKRANLATNEKELALQKELLLAEKERAARLNAEAMARSALEANNAMAVDIQAELAPKPGLQRLRIKLLRNAREGLTKILEQGRKVGSPDETIISTYFQLGDLAWNLGDLQTAKSEFQTGLDLAQQLAVSRPEDSVALGHLSNGNTKLGDAIQLLGDTKRAGDYFQRSLEINRALIARKPNDVETGRDLGIDLVKLGDVALRLGDPEKASEYYRECFDIRNALVASENTNVRLLRDLCSVHNRLGDAKLDSGNVSEALPHFKNALLISQDLSKLHTENLDVQRDFGLNSGRVGQTLKGLGRADEALKYFMDALNALQPLTEADPQNAELKRDLGGIYERLGDATLGLDDVAGALEYYKKGLTISQFLANGVIGSIEAQRDLSVSNEKLGDVLMAFGRPSDAVSYYKTALEISERLSVADPNNAQAQSDVGFGYLKLGQVMSMQAQFDEATKYQRRALELRLALATKNPTSSGAKTEAYCSHFLVGKSLLSGARYDEALLQFKSAQVVLEEMLSKGWHADANAQIELRSVEENKQQLKDCVWLCENAANAAADVQFVLDQAPKLVPSIMEVRIKTLMKAAQSDDAFRSAGNFETWIEQQKADKAENYFQAGCLYAMCVADDKTNLDECVVAAIGSIEKARAAGYFDKSKLLLMNQNPAFVAVRSHPKFSSFVNSVSIEK